MSKLRVFSDFKNGCMGLDIIFVGFRDCLILIKYLN